MNNCYVLLSKQELLPQVPTLYEGLACSKLAEVLAPFTGPTALDFETSGLDAYDKDAYIRCVSLANHEACIAIDLKSLGEPALNLFWDWAHSHPGFLIHNATFDAMWARVHGKPIKVHCCTVTLLRHLTTEGWAGQSWSLKTAMTEVLGWPEKNNTELKEWLAANKLKNWDMSQAPWDILGTYNALDASATYQLWEVLEEAAALKLPPDVRNNLREYHYVDCLTEIELLVEQHIKGIHINLDKLAKYETKLTGQIDALHQEFLDLPQVTKALEELRQEQLAELINAEPVKLTKTGSVAKRWEAWDAKVVELKAMPAGELFNVDSPKQLAWLFYTKLKFPIQRETEGGEPSVDNKALPTFGNAGKVLSSYRKLRDKLKFVVATQNVQHDGILHPTFTMSGTVTGRLAGGIWMSKLNLQQLPVDAEFLECFEAPPGYSLIYTDFSALEPHVLAEFSQDRRMLSLYGPGYPIKMLVARLQELKIRFTLENNVLEINDEDLHNLRNK